MHLKALGSGKHNEREWEVLFHDEFAGEFKGYSEEIRRRAILLVGGDKGGVEQDRFYRSLIETAERRFDQHQSELAAEKRKK